MLSEAHFVSLDRDLREVERLLRDVGWARFVLVHEDGVSLPAAVGLVCGVKQDFLTEDYWSMSLAVPAGCALRFAMLWDILEAAGGKDIVAMNEEWVSAIQPLTFLRNVADIVEIG